MFRVALVRAFSQSDFKEPAEPLSIEALAAVLRLHHIECRLFDRETDSMEGVVGKIVAYQPSLLAVSVLMEDNVPDALRLLLRMRGEYETPCVVGGMFVTTSYEKARALFPQHCELIAGEGEAALLRTVSRLTGESYPGMEKQHFQPDEWPWMYRPDLQDYLDMGAPINMRTSRGCPGRCRFCATPSLPYGLDKWVGRSIPDVVDEMQHLCERYKPHAFNFVDDDFGPLSRLEELVEELAKRGLRCGLSLQLRASAMCREPNLASRMRRLREGGLSRVFIGLESFDEQTLAYFNKKMNPLKALEAFRTIQEAGVAVHIGYILWHPLSTAESVRNEARMLKDAGFFTTKIIMAKLQLFPGCSIQKEQRHSDFSMPIDGYYEAVRNRAAPLYRVWLKGALDVPLRYCLANIEPDSNAPWQVTEIEESLSRLDELSYQILLDPESVSESEVLATAADTEERLHAIADARQAAVCVATNTTAQNQLLERQEKL